MAFVILAMTSVQGFKLERGIRQGYLLPAYISTMIIETLANKVTRDSTLKAIIIDNKELK